MKKISLTAMLDILNGVVYSEETVNDLKAELEAELNKGKAKADATKAEYEEIHDAVVNALRSASDPVTAQELADETGYTKGKIVYGLSHYWKDEIERIEGKVSTYTLKA